MNSFFPSNPSLYIDQCRKRYNLTISEQFINCANQQLTNLFVFKAGLNFNKKISIGWADEMDFFYVKGPVSKFLTVMWINGHINQLTILWKSKSGRVYDLEEKDIDCNDIEFWFEGLDPLLYHQQLFPKISLPFNLKDLTYKLMINRLNMNCIFEMQVKKEELKESDEFLKKIDQFIDIFNRKSEKNNREYGVIHNWKRKVEQGKLVYEIDTGFTGFYFLKKFLQFLSSLNCFDSVMIE